MLFLPFRVIYVHTKNHRNTRKEQEMKVNYNVTGKERKRLAEIIAKEIGVDARYLGAPTFAYQMDYFTVDRDGTLVFEAEDVNDEVERVFDAIAAAGFTPDEDDENSGIAIQMPMMTGDEISRLEQLVESKETLLKKAIGADSLMIGEKDSKLDFAWFKKDARPEEIHAYMSLVTALCKMAKESKRITAKDRDVENEKYAFRCFLLRLGFIGDEYKADRKILLQNLDGNSAWRNGAPKEA